MMNWDVNHLAYCSGAAVTEDQWCPRHKVLWLIQKLETTSRALACFQTVPVQGDQTSRLPNTPGMNDGLVVASDTVWVLEDHYICLELKACLRALVAFQQNHAFPFPQ